MRKPRFFYWPMQVFGALRISKTNLHAQLETCFVIFLPPPCSAQLGANRSTAVGFTNTIFCLLYLLFISSQTLATQRRMRSLFVVHGGTVKNGRSNHPDFFRQGLLCWIKHPANNLKETIKHAVLRKHEVALSYSLFTASLISTNLVHVLPPRSVILELHSERTSRERDCNGQQIPYLEAFNSVLQWSPAPIGVACTKPPFSSSQS